MYLGRVIGRLVPEMRHRGLTGLTLLWVQPVERPGDNDATETKIGKPLIAIDSVGAGNGELVFLVGAMEASFAVLPNELVPADAAIVGIVDSTHREVFGTECPGGVRHASR